MIIRTDFARLKRSRWYELVLRFVIGGFITAAAGLVAGRFGPGIGGLFLAFPAVFPATVTLIAKHERKKKAEEGLHGERRGIDAAALDACGSAMGSIGLVAFAFVNWRALPLFKPALVLAAATAVWLGIAWLAWWVRRKRPRHR